MTLNSIRRPFSFPFNIQIIKFFIIIFVDVNRRCWLSLNKSKRVRAGRATLFNKVKRDIWDLLIVSALDNIGGRGEILQLLTGSSLTPKRGLLSHPTRSVYDCGTHRIWTK